ncbi:DUF484 family protein [Pikeienuella piscinae]|uniref:DUF484 family protein n=2 Tax=Pikeienuella piscinae TaxID=2748098 RepID=A0A7M3T7H9_9RHOB|nr:DUF484 family protein [Pikeienuella piscinae]
MQALIDAEPAPGGRKVVDLRGALVTRLEARLDRLETTHRSVIAAAYENLAGTTQIQKAVLLLLAQNRFVDFLRALTLETPEMVAVDCARLCIETDEAAPGPLTGLDESLSESLVILPPGGVDAYFALGGAAGRPISLRPAVAEADAVFGDTADSIRSEALVRLDLGDGREGLLVFGAEDARRFGPEHGGDLLEFFGGVVERALRRWLAPES